jgi:hypothetical protein
MNQFYSMILYKAEILKYVKSDDDPGFKRFIIQFFSDETKDGVNYKMRGWVLQNDLSAYPQAGNLLAEGQVIAPAIKSPMYFTNCELRRQEFKKNILDKVGGLAGDWDLITLTPLQNSDGYLLVELAVALTALTTVTTVANPCPPKQPQG